VFSPLYFSVKNHEMVTVTGLLLPVAFLHLLH